MTGLEPIVLASIIGGVATAGSTAAGIIANRKKAPRNELLDKPKATPLAAESTELKPGQKTNGVMTGPQGLLSDAPTGRNALLGS